MQAKPLLAALCAAFAAGAAHAAPAPATVATTFSYTDFADRHGNPGEYYLSGAFRGTDTDGDGTLELAELTSLEVQGKQFVGCGADLSQFYNGYCGIARFTFTESTGALDFSVKWGDDGYVNDVPSWDRDEITTGDKVELLYVGHRGDVYGPMYYWTPATKLWIPAVVPEPAEAGMLAAGLALLGAVIRRRRMRASDAVGERSHHLTFDREMRC